MYLSRVEINFDNHRRIRDLTHLGAYHNWVEQSFPEEIEQHIRNRHLWRIDELNHKKYLLVLSESKPNLEKLEFYGVPGTAITKRYDTMVEGLNVGETYQFRLTANPSYKESKKGIVHQPRAMEFHKQWLLQRADKLGFEILRDASGNYAFEIVTKEEPYLIKNNKKFRLSKTTYQGYLKITNLERFKKTLMQGFGREKAFGMGLMTIMPA